MVHARLIAGLFCVSNPDTKSCNINNSERFCMSFGLRGGGDNMSSQKSVESLHSVIEMQTYVFRSLLIVTRPCICLILESKLIADN